ncbi:MAG: 30S ribosomal protein S20 [Erysipelotrichaceae bacterium]|jgi:small subunit ribosomal protein S20|nr:30S ribosomal protein S20 [Erysipelotrichaceae bacterium]
MPQIKSQKKRVLTNNKRSEAVKANKSALKTAIKDVRKAIAANDKDAAVKAFDTATSKLDKAVSDGIKHKNYSSRQKSRLATQINKIA